MFKNVRCCCFPKQNERIWFTQIDNMSLVSPLQFCSVRVGWKQKSTNPRNYVKATRAVCKHVSWVANDVNNVSLFFLLIQEMWKAHRCVLSYSSQLQMWKLGNVDCNSRQCHGRPQADARVLVFLFPYFFFSKLDMYLMLHNRALIAVTAGQNGMSHTYFLTLEYSLRYVIIPVWYFTLKREISKSEKYTGYPEDRNIRLLLFCHWGTHLFTYNLMFHSFHFIYECCLKFQDIYFNNCCISPQQIC